MLKLLKFLLLWAGITAISVLLTWVMTVSFLMVYASTVCNGGLFKCHVSMGCLPMWIVSLLLVTGVLAWEWAGGFKR